MSLLNQIYQQSLAENEKNFKFWEDYLNTLKSLDLSVYADKLKVPVLVPIGNRIHFRGELKHTNEVTVALGADYFVKCSLKQAEILRQHRIKGAEENFNIYKKEREYLDKQMQFNQQNVKEEGKDIVEVFTEEEDKAWREKHRENVRKYMQNKSKHEKPKVEITDDELWNRLEELELQEELENEMIESHNEINDQRNSLSINEDKNFISPLEELGNFNKSGANNVKQADEIKLKIENSTISTIESKERETDNSELLRKVLDKQNELENKIQEMKYREREPTKTEKDLIAKLDELDLLYEMEDDIDRLDDLLQTEDYLEDDIIEENLDSNDEHSDKSESSLRKISFADHDDPETLEITFKHSDIQPCKEPFDPKFGIRKPSDVYESFANLFDRKTTSILKKSKYESISAVKDTKHVKFDTNVEVPEIKHKAEDIVVKDIVEKKIEEKNLILEDKRPVSLFKKKRMQSKNNVLS